MSFIVIIPARLASTRLPNKPLADLGGKPMVVRVAERAALSGAARIIVATDHDAIRAACAAHGIEVCMTRADHPSGTDRIAEVARALGLSPDAVIVNLQGDEPLIDPALIRECADLLQADAGSVVATAAHAIDDVADFANPNVVKVVLDAKSRALYFSRAPLPWWRDASSPGKPALPVAGLHGIGALRHIGLYAYRAGFLRRFPTLAMAPLEKLESLEQLRVLWHGERIVVHVAPHAPPGGVDTAEDLARVRALVAGAAP